MTDDQKGLARMSDDQYVAEMLAHYRSGDALQAMPFTRDLMTLEELEGWVASRQEAGIKIDIETCEIARRYTCDFDVYGLQTAKGELPEELQVAGKNYFVRSPESRGWVHEHDLPKASISAMYERIDREVYARAHPEDVLFLKYTRAAIDDNEPPPF
jgi:hypothetical protein